MKNQISMFLKGIKTLKGNTCEMDDTTLTYDHLGDEETKKGYNKMYAAMKKDSAQLKKLKLSHILHDGFERNDIGIPYLELLILPAYLKVVSLKDLQTLVDESNEPLMYAKKGKEVVRVQTAGAKSAERILYNLGFYTQDGSVKSRYTHPKLKSLDKYIDLTWS